MPPGEDGLGNSRGKEWKGSESVSSKIVGKWRKRRRPGEGGLGGKGVKGV